MSSHFISTAQFHIDVQSSTEPSRQLNKQTKSYYGKPLNLVSIPIERQASRIFHQTRCVSYSIYFIQHTAVWVSGTGEHPMGVVKCYCFAQNAYDQILLFLFFILPFSHNLSVDPIIIEQHRMVLVFGVTKLRTASKCANRHDEKIKMKIYSLTILRSVNGMGFEKGEQKIKEIRRRKKNRLKEQKHPKITCSTCSNALYHYMILGTPSIKFNQVQTDARFPCH